MRQISRQEDYGIFLMDKLSANFGKGLLSLQKVANETSLSVFFLKQLAGKLRRAGLIKSKEGSGGGYELSRPPKKITLGMIVAAFSGPVQLVECCNKKNKTDCRLSKICKSKFVLRSISNEIASQLNSRTLASL